MERIRDDGYTETARTYTAFISRSIQFLYEVALFNPFRLWCALEQFVTFLPTEIKHKIRPRMNETANKLMHDRTISIYPSRRSLAARLYPHAQMFLDEVIQELDQRGYLEKQAVKPKFGKGELSP